jgi:hypothetical protein
MNHKNYSLEVEHREHQLYRIKFNFPYSHEEVVSELKNEKWRKFSETNTTGYEIWPLRFKILDPQSKLLREMQSFFHLEKSKADLVDYLFETSPNIRGNYGMTKDAFIKNTSFHGEFTEDKPGFECGRHIDFRLLAATGGISLNAQDDPELATYFYRSYNDAQEYARSTTNLGDGWMQVNDNDVWHDGGNLSKTKDRYSMLIALTIMTQYPTA